MTGAAAAPVLVVVLVLLMMRMRMRMRVLGVGRCAAAAAAGRVHLVRCGRRRGQALLMLLLLVEDDLRSDDGLNPLTGYNGYYRPATRTQSRRSLLYQMPAQEENNLTLVSA